ncbi:hypothetical protein DRW48_15735 [Paracoccus suum]|uniref:Uncharacterized protein n=1 Tax=Paracoccus suum TaxID=2259340 RepID=A0A344PNH8_9RHOB|nr:hypothetical protein [Paracoccus suum]AXC50933.1 hypothetical protein DRW48_15735 [Paracoccus suum]
MPKSTKPPVFAGFNDAPAKDAKAPAGIAGLPAGLTAPPKHPPASKAPQVKQMAVKPPPLPRRTTG